MEFENNDCDSHSESTPSDELLEALRQGDPEKVRALIEAGENICYTRDNGYNALLDGIHGRDIRQDLRLLELLSLLIAHGVDLCAKSSYGEVGLRILSNRGRFDAVQLLLDAGADRTQLGWTSLMEAVALGSLADVRVALKQEKLPGTTDRSRVQNPWSIALLGGDLSKVKLLREHGVDVAAAEFDTRPALFYAILGRNPEVLRWLLDEGADVHQTDSFGYTALIEATESSDLECIELLLRAGADVNAGCYGTALSRARSREIIVRLLDAGANPADADQRIILGLETTEIEAFRSVTPGDVFCSFNRSFGNNNPERMDHPFWEAMIRCGISAFTARRRFEEQCGPFVEPVWCACRYGQSLTLLPDGRAVQIGGEHEDFYDPDFCIYNDVFVHDSDGSITIYGYPESLFPPTDFHTATLVGDFIYVIGCIGYAGTRRFGQTPVYRLNIRTFQIEPLTVNGEAPGWIFKHRAVAIGTGRVRIWGGMVAIESEGKESHVENIDSFVLDLNRLEWWRESSSRS